MKKYILAVLYIVSFAQGIVIAQQIRDPQEWDAQAYAQGNRIQEEAALLFLNESGIDFNNKKILDVGCGTGNITATLATTAKHVHGIDASKNMIEYAQTQYGNTDKLTFEHCFAEDFMPTEDYDRVVSIFCLHWVKDKQKVFENINKSLDINGDFFGTIFTSSDPAPFGMMVLQELLQKPECDFLHHSTITQEGSLDRYLMSDEECKEMFKQTGFQIISYEKKSLVHTFKNREELAVFQRPVAMSRSFFKALPEEQREWLFNEYIDLFLSKLKKDENNNYLFNGTPTTVIHARKIAEIG